MVFETAKISGAVIGWRRGRDPVHGRTGKPNSNTHIHYLLTYRMKSVLTIYCSQYSYSTPLSPHSVQDYFKTSAPSRE